MLAVKLPISKLDGSFFFSFPVFPPPPSPPLPSFIDAHHVSLQSLFLFGVGRERMTSRSEGQGREKGREGGAVGRGGIK